MKVNSKNKKPIKTADKKDTEPAVFRRGKFELAVGTRVEAKDYLGNW